MVERHTVTPSHRRNHYAADITGAEIMRTIRDEARNMADKIEVFEFSPAIELVLNERGPRDVEVASIIKECVNDGLGVRSSVLMFRPLVTAAILCVIALGCGAGSDDGWNEESLPTRAEFRGIFFLDPDRGFVVGGNYFIDGGIIGATEDGGRSWSFQSGLVKAKAGFSLNDIVFLDRFVGIAVGSHGVILRTTDRGRNWHPVLPYSGGTNHFLDLFFLDEQHGWAVGFNGVVHTVDGGRSWSWLGEHRAISGDAIHFFDPSRGLVAGKHGRIHLTTDAGESWTRVTEEDRTGTKDLLAMTFVGPMRGWAAGSEGAILHTKDGGHTWKRQHSGMKGRITDIAFVGPHQGWALAADRSTSSTVILRTSDGGATWREDRFVEGELLRGLFFFGDSHGWAVGARPDHGPQALLRYRGQ